MLLRAKNFHRTLKLSELFLGGRPIIIFLIHILIIFQKYLQIILNADMKGKRVSFSHGQSNYISLSIVIMRLINMILMNWIL